MFNWSGAIIIASIVGAMTSLLASVAMACMEKWRMAILATVIALAFGFVAGGFAV